MLSGKRFQATIQRNGWRATSMSVSEWVSESDCQKEQQQAHKQDPQWHSSSRSNCESIVTGWRNWRATQDDEFMGGWDCAGGQNGKVPVPREQQSNQICGECVKDSRFVTSYLSLWQCVMRWPRIQLTGLLGEKEPGEWVLKERNHSTPLLCSCHAIHTKWIVAEIIGTTRAAY